MQFWCFNVEKHDDAFSRSLGFLDGAFGGASDALNEAFSFAASPLDKFNDLAEVSSGGMDTFTQAMPRLSDMAMSFDDFDLMGIPDIPTMPDMLTMPEVRVCWGFLQS
jgi:hypothetical protein